MRGLAKRPGADRSGSIVVLALSATIWIGSLAGVSPGALEGQDRSANAVRPSESDDVTDYSGMPPITTGSPPFTGPRGGETSR